MDLFYVGYPNALNAIAGYYEITSGAAFFTPCHGPGLCNSWNSGQGATQSGFGPTISNNGYQAQMISMRNSQAQTVAYGEANQYLDGHPGLTYQNAPSAMAGNGTYSVAGLFRFNGPSSRNAPLWFTGDYSSTNTSVALQYGVDGANLELAWNTNARGDRWRFNSGFTMLPGTWYFIAVTVQANGATPIAHMWVSQPGSMVDKIADVPFAKTGGSPTQTPNVTAAPMCLGLATGGVGGNANASYAGLYIYNRVLSYSEVQVMYTALKRDMVRRAERLP
jgi:hypothetical protein